MLTSKQRATLRGIASTYETIFQVGKGGISDTDRKSTRLNSSHPSSSRMPSSA